MQQASPVRVGVVGCGNVAVNRHLPVLQALRDAEVVALADTSREQLERAANRFRVGRRYESYGALLADPAVDVVAICTPPQTHVEIALAALEADKHSLIEKPLSLSLFECDELIERAAASSCKVMVGFNMRWHRLVRQARGKVERSELGTLKAVRYVATGQYQGHGPDWLRHRALGGGMLVESAVHAFDLWRFLLHSEVEEIYAASEPGRWEDETAAITARMASGVLATALLSKDTAESHVIELYGEKARLSLCRYRWDGLQMDPASSLPFGMRRRLRGALHTLKAVPQAIPSFRHGGDLVASFRAEWLDFIASIRQDTPVGCTLEDGRRAVEAALAATASASGRRAVKVCRAPRRITQIPAAD